MTIIDEQVGQSAKTTDPYRALDISKSEIRLLSFENTSEYAPVRLKLHYVSLNDWKPEYVSFCNENALTSSPHLSKAWSDRLEFTLATPQHEIYDRAPRANVADVVDRNTHVLRVGDIFARAFSVTVWIKEKQDLEALGLYPPGEQPALCEVILQEYGRGALEELLGVRNREWGVAEDEDEQLMKLVEDVDVLVFDQYHWADYDDEDQYVFGTQHLRDIVRVEMWQMFRKKYWSRLWIIQELAVSPDSSTVHWGESVFHLSTLQAVGDILIAHPESGHPDSRIWKELKPGLDLLAFVTTWRTLEITSGATERSLNDASIPELNLLAQRASCSLPHDKVYGLLGLFMSSISSAVTIDYNREIAEVLEDFCSMVPSWDCN